MNQKPKKILKIPTIFDSLFLTKSQRFHFACFFNPFCFFRRFSESLLLKRFSIDQKSILFFRQKFPGFGPRFRPLGAPLPTPVPEESMNHEVTREAHFLTRYWPLPVAPNT